MAQNTLHLAAEALTSVSATALSQGHVSLSVGLDTFSIAILREADDAQEQIEDGLDAEAAMCQGLNAAVWRVLGSPPPAVPGLRRPLGLLLTAVTWVLAGVGLLSLIRAFF